MDIILALIALSAALAVELLGAWALLGAFIAVFVATVLIRTRRAS